mmetsp:Transcript_46826/g.151102  ORF Transcript_46826/g.151102 Transcript_46826/m.151102 type:complete len:593 (+) Transcript_46826:28-1806(+)
MAPTQVDSTKLAAAASSEGAASSSAGAAPDDEPPDLPFDMFSMRKPKNLIAGASSGLKSALKGVVGGTVGLIAAPIVGAQTQGVGGFFTGLVTGILGAVALPVAGAAVGCLQVTRGAINTVEEVVESNKGKDWDQEKREWYEYNLQTDAQLASQLEDEAGGGAGGGGGGGGELPPCGKGEPFLCTGDLGFVWESRLYIVGRIKDILCIRGRTLHAHDIETCAEAAHTAMRPGCCAALPVVPPDTGQDTDGEALVLVAELKPEAEKAAAAGGGAAIAEAVRDGVREAEGVKAYAVVLLRARTILKTTSGKLRRRELRLAYAELDDAVRAAAAAAADGRKAEPAQKLRVPLDAVLHFWRDAGKPARKAAEPDAEPDPAAGGGLAVSLQEGSEKVQLPVRSVPRNDSELSALGTARGSEPSREPSRGDAAGKAEAELDDAGGGGPSATEQLSSGAELDSLDGERREAGREMMLAAAEGAAEAGCSPGMGWALRRTYLLAWGLHIPADDSLHATSAPAGGRASGSELGSCVEGLAELLHGCNLSGSMAAAGAWFEEQGLDTVAELKKARMEADFVAALQLKPGKERVLLADIDSFY